MQRRIALALGVVVAAGAVVAAVAAQAEPVTLQISQYRNANGLTVLRFTGRIASGAGGEVVEIVGQGCGERGFRLISSARTTGGGAYEAENPMQVAPWTYTPVSSGTTFRARWDGKLSAPEVWRQPAPLGVVGLRDRSRRAWRVYVSPPPPWTVSMKGKVVELQRRSGGAWRTIERKRLVFRPRLQYGGAYNHEVVFEVPRRGWTLRAVLPAASAAPCYAEGATAAWRS